MRSGFYMHENAMDVCIEILRLQYTDAKRVKLKIRWWNLGYVGNPFCIDARGATITIKASDIHKWKYLNSQHFLHKRRKPGFPELN